MSPRETSRRDAEANAQSAYGSGIGSQIANHRERHRAASDRTFGARVGCPLSDLGAKGLASYYPNEQVGMRESPSRKTFTRMGSCNNSAEYEGRGPDPVAIANLLISLFLENPDRPICRLRISGKSFGFAPPGSSSGKSRHGIQYRIENPPPGIGTAAAKLHLGMPVMIMVSPLGLPVESYNW